MAALTVLAGGYLALRHGVPSPWLLRRRVEALALRWAKASLVASLAAPPQRYKAYAFQGRMREGHPRILFPSEAAYDGLRARYAADERYRRFVDEHTRGGALFAAAAAWACKGDREAGQRGMEELLRCEMGEPTDSNAGDGLDMALAYDLLGNLPDWDSAGRSLMEQKLAHYVRSGLRVLDGDSASLWHGRTQLALSVWVAAVAADGPVGDIAELRRRSQAHFMATLQAVELSEGWPEGYTYWINNRAFAFAVACAAHVNAVEAPEVNASIRRVIERVGLWTIQGTEPAGRFHLFADSGPRNDLRDETERAVDVFALVTGDPLLRDYSRYLFSRFMLGAYYGPYRWGLPLFSVASHPGPPAPVAAIKDLTVFQGRLPTSAVFGRESLGQVFVRSDWGPDATFVSYQAGHQLTHHGHYQAGHFTIVKKAPLAITSGTYGDYFGTHRLNYYMRTVASNSLLVLRPGERVQPNKFFAKNVADGGQRITMPTGSALVNVQDWKDNLYRGKHYEGGQIRAFENSDPRFVYVGSDLTGAYNNTKFDDNGDGGKVSRVTRQFVYLGREDAVIVYDRVGSTDPLYTKKWLLHSWGRPETATERVLVGTRKDGILETSDARARITNGEGILDVQRLLPLDAVLRKVGGPDFRYYVEADGDDSTLDGQNMAEGATEKPWFDAGLWRIEFQPGVPRKEDRFLVVLFPGIKGSARARSASLVSGDAFEGAVTDSSVVVFGREGLLPARIHYGVTGPRRLHVVVDVPRSVDVRVSSGGETRILRTTSEGVLSFEASGLVELEFAR